MVRSFLKPFKYNPTSTAGKTTTTEFTVTNAGPNTTNPRDPNRTPGGSSCGSAAAVADKQVPLSLGVQTGGSVIRPAAYTGVFAMKPTYNAISSEGTKTFSITFDTIGFFARSIEDLQLVAEVLMIEDDEPPNDISLKEASVALIKTPMWPKAGPSTEAAMKQAADILQASGVRVEEIPLPPEIGGSEAFEQMQRIIMKREAQVALLREYRVDKTRIAPSIRRIVENSSNSTHKEQTHAEDTLASIRSVMDKLAANYSAIITPSAVDEAPLGLDDMGSPVFNTLWTASVSILLVSFSLTWCRVFMDPSSIYPHSLEPIGCLSAYLSWQADIAISTFCRLAKFSVNLLWTKVVGRLVSELLVMIRCLAFFLTVYRI